MALGVWSRLQSLMFGGAIGAAAADAIKPSLEPARQHGWSRNRNRVLDPATAARLRAQGLIKDEVAEDEAGRDGYNADRLQALVQLALEAPSIAEALLLWRRDEISEAQVDHALAKAQVEPQYWPAIKQAKVDRLDLPVIALAIVRGIMADPGILPVPPPTGTGKVPPFPVSKLDTLKESEAAGYDMERLFVQTAISGRPMGPQEAARAAFRSIIEKVDFERAISEGDVRNEWAQSIFEVAREIPSTTNYVEGRLRGWLDDQHMNAGTAKHGMSEADTHLLFQIHGRPPSWHQVWIGLQRGGVYNGPLDVIEPAFLKALEESDLRPEWYNLLWHSRYTYPAAFVLRKLAESGDITQAETEEILKFEGWEPTLRKKVAARWSGQTDGTAGAATTKKAETQLWTAIHKAYVGGAIDAAKADKELSSFVPTEPERQAVIKYWTQERALEAVK